MFGSQHHENVLSERDSVVAAKQAKWIIYNSSRFINVYTFFCPGHFDEQVKICLWKFASVCPSAKKTTCSMRKLL